MEALFNKREWLQNAAPEAMQERTDDGHAFLGGEVKGKEEVERKKTKRLVCINSEQNVERGESIAKTGEHGGLVNMGFEPAPKNPSKGLKQKEDAPILLEAKVSSRGGMGREGDKNGGGVLGKRSRASLPSLADEGIKYDGEGIALLPRGQSSAKKPLIGINSRRSDEVDTNSVGTSVAMRSELAGHSGKMSVTGVGLPRAPSVDGRKQAVPISNEKSVNPSSLREKKPDFGGKVTQKMVPLATIRRVQVKTTQANGISRATFSEGANPIAKQPMVSQKRACELSDGLSHTSKWTSFDLLVLEVLANAKLELGSVPAIAAKELKLAKVNGGPNVKCDTRRNVCVKAVRSMGTIAFQVKPNPNCGRLEAVVEPTLRFAATKRKASNMMWGSPSETDTGAQKVASILLSLGVATSRDMQQGTIVTRAIVLSPVDCDERVNDAHGLISNSRMEEEDEKGGAEPVGKKVNEDCGADFCEILVFNIWSTLVSTIQYAFA